MPAGTFLFDGRIGLKWVHVLNVSEVSDRHQILLLVLSEFKQINFYSPWNHQENLGLVMISRGVEINLLKFA